MECINLMERFGRRYRIGFDPAYDPKGRRRNRLDPWYMTVECHRGTVYPYGGNRLAVEVEGRPITARKLRDLDCTTQIQEGDDIAAFAFDAADFPAVAKIVKPRRRRQASAKQRAAARRHALHLNRRKAVPEHSRRAPTPDLVGT